MHYPPCCFDGRQIKTYLLLDSSHDVDLGCAGELALLGSVIRDGSGGKGRELRVVVG